MHNTAATAGEKRQHSETTTKTTKTTKTTTTTTTKTSTTTATPANETVVEYCGFHPPSSSWTPDRVDLDAVAPREFYERYVATRMPCVLTGSAISSLQKTLGCSDFLRRNCGDQSVFVETKGPTGNFGTGFKRQSMRFADFLDMLKTNPNLYMTTQYDPDEDSNDAGDSDVHADFHSEAGVDANTDADSIVSVSSFNSSNADANENHILSVVPPPLYALINGSNKESNKAMPPLPPVIAPTLVPQMMNMWIGATLPDQPTTSMLHLDYADNMYYLLRGTKTFNLVSPRDIPHMRLHGALHRVSKNGLAVFDPDTREDGASQEGVRRWELTRAQAHLDELHACDAADDEIDAAQARVLAAFNALDNQSENATEEEDVDSDDGAEYKTPKVRKMDDNARTVDSSEEKPPPQSFSSLQTVRNAKASAPDCKYVRVELRAGEGLYLPASWIHEVESKSDEKHDIHVALNYWFFPPSMGGSFDAPYEDEFWRLTHWQPVAKRLGCNMQGNP